MQVIWWGETEWNFLHYEYFSALAYVHNEPFLGLTKLAGRKCPPPRELFVYHEISHIIIEFAWYFVGLNSWVITDPAYKCNIHRQTQTNTYTVKRRLSERQLSETSINRTLKETTRACPSAIFCMFTIAASTVRNVRRLWNVRMAEKPKKEGQNGDIYREKAEICKHREVELPLLLFQKILSRQIRYHE